MSKIAVVTDSNRYYTGKSERIRDLCTSDAFFY